MTADFVGRQANAGRPVVPARGPTAGQNMNDGMTADFVRKEAVARGPALPAGRHSQVRSRIKLRFIVAGNLCLSLLCPATGPPANIVGLPASASLPAKSAVISSSDLPRPPCRCNRPSCNSPLAGKAGRHFFSDLPRPSCRSHRPSCVSPPGGEAGRHSRRGRLSPHRKVASTSLPADRLA